MPNQGKRVSHTARAALFSYAREFMRKGGEIYSVRGIIFLRVYVARVQSIRRRERKPWRRPRRSIGICEVNRRLSRLYHGILSRGMADKDSSQFTVMPGPAGKTREGNPVARFSSRYIPNLDGDRLPFQCPALGYHAPRART